jgi:hypothetical protein
VTRKEKQELTQRATEGTEKEKMENRKWKREKRNNGENTGLEYGSPAAALAILGNGASPKVGAGRSHCKS